ncbi:alkaline ceramidase ydc1 [Sorochytrium milnesiophthora]
MQPAHVNITTDHHSWVTDSLVDWCEGNFEIVWFVAEFFNTITNLWMIAFALVGIWASKKYGYMQRYTLAYVCLMLVGIGSTLFHGTLTYRMQLLDELPMLFACSVFLYASLSMGKSSRPVLAVVLALCPVVTAIYYIDTRHAEFFQYIYTAQVVLIVARHGYLLTQVPAEFKPTAKMLMYYGLGMYLTASAFWVTDNLLCYSHLTPLKELWGWPMRAVLELHGWWHFFSGLGTYVSIGYSVYAREVLFHRGQKPVYVRWLAGVLPVVHFDQPHKKMSPPVSPRKVNSPSRKSKKTKRA